MSGVLSLATTGRGRLNVSRSILLAVTASVVVVVLCVGCGRTHEAARTSAPSASTAPPPPKAELEPAAPPTVAVDS